MTAKKTVREEITVETEIVMETETIIVEIAPMMTVVTTRDAVMTIEVINLVTIEMKVVMVTSRIIKGITIVKDVHSQTSSSISMVIIATVVKMSLTNRQTSLDNTAKISMVNNKAITRHNTMQIQVIIKEVMTLIHNNNNTMS